MALVYIVYAPTADMMGPDLDRMNRVEEMPDEVARTWVAGGVARTPTDEELAAYEESRKAQDQAETEDLGSLKKDELVAVAERRGVDITAAKTKADIVTALEQHSAEQPAGDVNPDSAATGERVEQPMVVTDAQGNDVSGAEASGASE